MMWQRVACERERNDAPGTKGTLMLGDALLGDLSAWFGKVQCVYLDPPYYTGERFSFRMRIGEEGWLTGKRCLDLPAYTDFSGRSEEDYVAFLREAIHLARMLLTPSGSFFLQLDGRMSARARLLCDDILGREQFRNEIIWGYQTGGRSLKYFSRKHDTILFYARSKDHFFDITQVPTAKKESRSNHLKRHVDAAGRAYRTIKSNGKIYTYYDDEPSYPDDVWTDLSQMQQKDPQRTGYATQKPQGLLDRIILCCTRPGDLVCDFMCGSGTTLISAASNGRPFLGMDSSLNAFSVCRKRLAHTPLTSLAPFSSVPAMLDASVAPGIGYYSVTLNAYTLQGDAFEPYQSRAGAGGITGLDAVDQWYAGLLGGDTFIVYASSLRQKKTPRLAEELQIPLLRGGVGILVIDVLGNRSLWTASGQL
ncbi:MAG: site-specific DNA-methyltransferase [Christensenellales bacterium]